jgi:hypothetical protein
MASAMRQVSVMVFKETSQNLPRTSEGLMSPIWRMEASLSKSNPRKQATSIANKKIEAMLSAINEIRSARDITLDCETYIYPYLGRSDQLKYYVDLLAEIAIVPQRSRQTERYYFGFRIHYSTLRNVPNSRFGVTDVVAVQFETFVDDLNSTIHSCKAVLRAAPHYL